MFYQLCDQYGFMVIDEADNESHGASALYCKENDIWENHVETWIEPFADNPDFMEATMDRTQRCVQRDKNRPSVICWSMGNGPGDLDDYWLFIQKHDFMCGGFVWEWCDHAVYAGIAENG